MLINSLSSTYLEFHFYHTQFHNNKYTLFWLFAVDHIVRVSSVEALIDCKKKESILYKLFDVLTAFYLREMI